MEISFVLQEEIKGEDTFLVNTLLRKLKPEDYELCNGDLIDGIVYNKGVMVLKWYRLPYIYNLDFLGETSLCINCEGWWGLTKELHDMDRSLLLVIEKDILEVKINMWQSQLEYVNAEINGTLEDYEEAMKQLENNQFEELEEIRSFGRNI